jgi:broad specificity phosphatase PhoE
MKRFSKRFSIFAWVFYGTLFPFFGVFGQSIVLVAHGHAKNTDAAICTSDISLSSNYPLTEKGEEQIRLAASEINKHSLQFSHIFVSPLFRTQQTAKILTQHLTHFQAKFYTEPLITQLGCGKLEGKPWLIDGVDRSKDPIFEPETPEQCTFRLSQFLTQLKARIHSREISGDVLVVGHKAPLELLSKLLGRPCDFPNGKSETFDLSVLQ